MSDLTRPAEHVRKTAETEHVAYGELIERLADELERSAVERGPKSLELRRQAAAVLRKQGEEIRALRAALTEIGETVQISRVHHIARQALKEPSHG